MGLLEQLVLVGIILGYGVALSRFIPAGWHFVANIAFATVVVIYGLQVGLDYTDMGLSLHFIKDGLVVALVATLLIIVAVAIVTRVNSLRRFFSMKQIMKPGRLAYESVVRIPLSTALTEEVLFRGVLFGLFMHSYGALLGAIYSSVVFGVWHILPSQQGLQNRGGDAVIINRTTRSFYALANVVSTSIAGMLFCWLRVLAGSILAPWLVHWTINSAALLAAHNVSKTNSTKSDRT